METLHITLKIDSPAQIEAIKAFFKSLKIKHTIRKSDDARMSKDKYYAILQERIHRVNEENTVPVSPENQKHILFGE